MTLESLTQNINNLPREEQMVNIEDDADDNQTVDNDDKKHSNEDIWPVLDSLVHYFSDHGGAEEEMFEKELINL
jgi:hemerythrin